MATYTCDTATHQTLAANTVDTVTINRAGTQLIVLNRGTSDLYYRSDGGAPTVLGADSKVVPGGMWLSESYNDTPPFTVELISVGNTAYSVQIA